MNEQASHPKIPRYRAAGQALAFLLTPRRDRGAQDEADRSAGAYLAPCGLGIGVVYALAFGLVWGVFGEYQGIRWIPVAAVLVLDLAWLGYRLVLGAAEVATAMGADQSDPLPTLNVAGVLAVVLLALCKFALLASLPIGMWQTSPAGWAEWDGALGRLAVLAPTPVFRPLVLMPLWGRWAMGLALTIGRAAPGCGTRLQRMSAGIALKTIFGQWMLCAILTTAYSCGAGEYLARAVLIGPGVLILTYGASYLLARRFNGQTEATVGAIGAVGELGFLVLFTAVASAIYWY